MTSPGDRKKGNARRLAVAFSIIFILSFFPAAVMMPETAEGKTTRESEHEYHNDEWTFLVISFLMAYATMAILTSLFALRFAQRKAKIVAIPVLFSGLLIWGFFILFKVFLKAEYPDDTIFGFVYWATAPILKPLMAVLGIILGVGLALFIFLTVVVRS